MNVFIVSASGGKKNKILGQILIFWGLLYRPPFTDQGQMLCAIADSWFTLTCQVSSRSVYSVALCWRTTPIFAVFELRHLVLSPIGINLRMLSTGAQLQTFLYPTALKSFLYSNAFMAKWRTISDVEKRDEQTNSKNFSFGGPIP